MPLMGSPFPGMDPYLEAHWLDVHTKLVAYAADTLNTRLPDDLIARTEERVGIEADDTIDLPQTISPDVSVRDLVTAAATTAPEQQTGRPWAPYRLLAVIEPITERFIEIIEADNEKLVTVIEFVSPTNKRGKGLRALMKKRRALLAGNVNVVEIDLTRQGDWRALLRPHRCPIKAIAAYRAAIRVASESRAVYLHPISIREKLPALRIPLRQHDEPIELPLQALIDQTYANGRYARTINYSKPPDPLLDENDAVWADSLLRSAGKR